MRPVLSGGSVSLWSQVRTRRNSVSDSLLAVKVWRLCKQQLPSVRGAVINDLSLLTTYSSGTPSFSCSPAKHVWLSTRWIHPAVDAAIADERGDWVGMRC